MNKPKDKFDEIYDRIQTFNISSAPGSAVERDTQAILDILADLTTEIRRQNAVNIRAFEDLTPSRFR